MKFINHTTRNFYSTMCGNLMPGRSGGDTSKGALLSVMKRVVDTCGRNLFIVLDDQERKYLEKIMALDKLGRSFRPSSIPKDVLKDPLGLKKAANTALQVQKAAMDIVTKRNNDKKNRHALVNGEVQEFQEGGDAKKALDSGELNGFKDLVAENAKIAARKDAVAQGKIGDLAKDPIISGDFSSVSKGGTREEPSETTSALPTSVAKPGTDATRDAAAKTPKIERSTRAGEMDAKAADIASLLEFGNGNVSREEV